MKIAIYARVSTVRQENDMQLTPLREFAARMQWDAVEYLEKESSVKVRPVFERLMADARLKKFELILVWKIDRFARSIKQFIDSVLILDGVGVTLQSLTQNVCSNKNDPMGRFVLDLFALLAQLERAIIVERVRAGVAEAQRRGKLCGRPVKIFNRERARKLRKEGMSWRKIAADVGVPFSTVRDELGRVRKASRKIVK